MNAKDSTADVSAPNIPLTLAVLLSKSGNCTESHIISRALGALFLQGSSLEDATEHLKLAPISPSAHKPASGHLGSSGDMLTAFDLSLGGANSGDEPASIANQLYTMEGIVSSTRLWRLRKEVL